MRYAIYLVLDSKPTEWEKENGLADNKIHKYAWAVCRTKEKAEQTKKDFQKEMKEKAEKSKYEGVRTGLKAAKFKIEEICLCEDILEAIGTKLSIWAGLTDYTPDLASNLIDAYIDKGIIKSGEGHLYELAAIDDAKEGGYYVENI